MKASDYRPLSGERNVEAQPADPPPAPPPAVEELGPVQPQKWKAAWTPELENNFNQMLAARASMAAEALEIVQSFFPDPKMVQAVLRHAVELAPALMTLAATGAKFEPVEAKNGDEESPNSAS